MNTNKIIKKREKKEKKGQEKKVKFQLPIKFFFYDGA